MSSNLKENCYACATGCRKLYICLLYRAVSLKWLGNTGLTQDPSCDGGVQCAFDTK